MSATNGHRPAAELRGAPGTASQRGYLRAGLPALYQDGDFGMRFVGALEHVLDPLVGLLDGLHAHLDPELAPEDLLELMTAWLGVGTDATLPLDRRRAVLREAAAITRLRGTRDGLELTLRLSFPELGLSVEDDARARWSSDPTATPAPSSRSFVVRARTAPSDAQRDSIARVVREALPVRVRWILLGPDERRPRP